jgi:hypothetical protein
MRAKMLRALSSRLAATGDATLSLRGLKLACQSGNGSGSLAMVRAPVELPNIPKAFSLVSRLTVCDQKSPTHYNRNFDSSVKHARPSTA